MSSGMTDIRARGNSLDPRQSKEKSEELLRFIEEHFSRNKPYLQPDYSSLDLSNELNVCYQYLSFVINHCRGKSFKDFLNAYRVAHAIELMKDPGVQQYTLEWLGQKAGFGSRTTFFRAFQRVTGQPPSQFKKSYNTAETGGVTDEYHIMKNPAFKG